AVGSGAYTAAIFIMVTHAFYKALLFLGAGSVIHGLHDEQDLKRMGGLAKYMPVTAFTFFVAWFAIAGVPPFSGFWSKGAVLLDAFPQHHAMWALGEFTIALTAYYIGREFWLCFFGEDRWRRLADLAGGDPSHHGGGVGAAGGPVAPHESRPVMTIPLVALAVAAFFGGFLDLPFHPNWAFLDSWLAPVVGRFEYHFPLGLSWKVGLPVMDGVVAVIGVAIVTALWLRHWDRPRLEPDLLQKGWYFDAFYDSTVGRPGYRAAGFAAFFFDNRVIDGGVNGAAHLIAVVAGRVRRIQTGYVRNYALGLAFGAVAIMAWVLSRAGV
ncbi:MAG: proton-conducting transporter membrane subunit, partial [Acidimicrobiales bacterium]